MQLTGLAVIMADFCGTYQPVLKMVEDFLKNIEELTNENKGRLTKLGEISEIAASIVKEKGEVKEADHYITLIENLSRTLLFGFYTELLTKLSDIFSMVNEMENKLKEDKSLKLPEVMQGRVDAVKDYLGKAKGRLEEMDKMLSDLVPKVRIYYLLHVTTNLRLCRVNHQ